MLNSLPQNKANSKATAKTYRAVVQQATEQRQRAEQVKAENAAWGAQYGYSADELEMLFA
jgi:hypothetical protein